MSYSAYDRMGATVQQPGIEAMKELLASVSVNDPEHPDVSLNIDDGWSLSYYPSRTMIFENVETDEGPWHLKGVTPELALTLWVLLSQGRLAEVESQEWIAGYGH